MHNQDILEDFMNRRRATFRKHLETLERSLDKEPALSKTSAESDSEQSVGWHLQQAAKKSAIWLISNSLICQLVNDWLRGPSEEEFGDTSIYVLDGETLPFEWDTDEQTILGVPYEQID